MSFYPNPWARAKQATGKAENSDRIAQIQEMMRHIPDCRATPECARHLLTACIYSRAQHSTDNPALLLWAAAALAVARWWVSLVRHTQMPPWLVYSKQDTEKGTPHRSERRLQRGNVAVGQTCMCTSAPDESLHV